MQFRAEEYYQAALERMRQARRLYDGEESYALAMYCGGLAVECLLRAFRWSKDPTFEARHDLLELLKSGGVLGIDEEYMRRRGASDDEIRNSGLKLRGAMNETVVLWDNSLRFTSETSLRAFLKRRGRLQRIKGNALKKNARDLLDATQTIIDRGVALWTSKTKSQGH